MAAKASAPSTAQAAITVAARASWLPMIIILLAQIQMAFNVNALPVSIGRGVVGTGRLPDYLRGASGTGPVKGALRCARCGARKL